jgi:hypothetical protein
MRQAARSLSYDWSPRMCGTQATDRSPLTHVRGYNSERQFRNIKHKVTPRVSEGTARDHCFVSDGTSDFR